MKKRHVNSTSELCTAEGAILMHGLFLDPVSRFDDYGTACGQDSCHKDRGGEFRFFSNVGHLGLEADTSAMLNHNQQLTFGLDLAMIRARREAEQADQEYRVAIRKLDRQRLGLEERIEDVLKTLQKWELDRLRAVKTGASTTLFSHV